MDITHNNVKLSTLDAATIIVLLLNQDRSIMAVKVIKEWCDCNLRSAVNMMRAFRDMGGSTVARIEKVEAALPLGCIAEVV